MIYYVSKVFWLIAAPTSALVLISAIAALWAVLGSSKFAARLASAAACGLVIGAFTPIGVALTVPLGYRFPFGQPDLQAPRMASSFSRAPVMLGLMRCQRSAETTPRRASHSAGLARPRSKDLPVWAVTQRAFTWRADHGRLPRMHCTPPRCSNQSPVKGGCWSR